MKKSLIVAIGLLFMQNSWSQDYSKAISLGVPFLMVAADARSAGMADQGVATSTDAFSQQYNPAKYAFSTEKQGFSISYTPYLTGLVNDISLGQATYFNRISERSAFAGSLRFFGLGDIELRQTDDPDEQTNVVSPNEFAIDGSYSLKLSDRFSMAVAGRYIRSSLRIQSETTDAKPASTFAVDLAGFYQSEEIAYDSFNGRWRAGFNIQNVGPKVSYNDDELGSSFIPANLRLGTGFDFILDDYNKVSVNLELTKLLVPTPQNPDIDGDGIITPDERSQTNDDYRRIGWFPGMFKSFTDAPGGFSEELQELTYSLGTEYLYQDSFALRAGYFHENPEKGARKFFSLGAGFKYNVVKIDVSYLFSASKVRSPLENTLRFSLTFNFGDKYDEY
ncbi:type IX secretion system outer membrane channel protein PorV [Flavobacterium sp.]|uniref:type IX secretion system outer membrane channel protein PorV n=1 Tax=Flavobacterium sp. TaxID=239 RepID=UPI00261616B4|nr:type IX secretion system outer membrane channel protein PorV [Flavobacterium sp.]MDD3003474.1 type IX secretion system outer membrane channel protein PorV [Flavobacterium sp.]